MNAIVKAESRGEIMEQVLIRGDLSKLTVEERGEYYTAVCTSVGLNPLTKPFEYITLNGKLRLYALKDCTDQLRSIHGISVTELVESEREGVFIVKAKVANAQGRTDVSTGAVNIAGMKGEALANSLMKAETKAKRRATLSICGLGLLDETEVEDIPDSAKSAPRDSAPPRQVQPIIHQVEPPKKAPDAIVQPSEPNEGPHKIVGGTYASWSDSYIEAIGTSGDTNTVYKWIDANTPQLEKLGKSSPSDAARVRKAVEGHIAFLRRTEPKPAEEPQEQPALDIGDAVPERPKATRGRPKGSTKVPDIEKDYDSFVSWSLLKIREADDGGALETFFTTTIEPHEKTLFPPDWNDLCDALEAQQTKLKEDGNS